MYGCTMHVPAPRGAYVAMHRAKQEVIDEDGGGFDPLEVVTTGAVSSARPA